MDLSTVTRESVVALARENPEAVADLVMELIRRVRQLEAQMAGLLANSRTSSKPPSSDRHNPNKPAPKSLRQPSGRKPGGQPGHEGHTLALSANPDEVVRHAPPMNCSRCAQPLVGVQPVGVERRQVIEVRLARRWVREHRAEVVRCPRCHWRVPGEFPEGVTAAVQYGASVRTVVTYLSVFQLLPAERLSEVMAELCDCPLSAGSIPAMVQGAGEAAVPVLGEIKERLLQSPWVSFDETGLSLGGDLLWLHTASNAQFTALHIHEKRGTEGIKAGGIIETYRGRALHDGLSAYRLFTQCLHGLCNAHHLRELTFVEETLGQAWAGKMAAWLREAKARVEEEEKKGGAPLGQAELGRWQDRYLGIIEEGMMENPEPAAKAPGQKGRPARGKALNLLNRLLDHQEAVVAFLLVQGVPFDNNHAERDLRMMKLRQKISGCFRARRLAECFVAVRSVIATARKHAAGTLEAIAALFAPAPTLAKILVPQAQGP